MACLIAALCRSWEDRLEASDFFADADFDFNIVEHRDGIIHLLAGTNIWLRLEESFPPMENLINRTAYNWKEVEDIPYVIDITDDVLGELRDYLGKAPEPDDGVYQRLPYEEYVRGWNNGSLSLFVDRGLARILYQNAPQNWAQWLPSLWLVCLIVFLPTMFIAGFIWGLGILILGIMAHKVLSSKAAEWVRQDSLSSQVRYRGYLARNIVWAQKVQQPGSPAVR